MNKHVKYALITGAGRGLGKGFVDYLLDEGYVVFAGVRSIKPEFKNTENLKYIVLDVSSDKSIDNALTKIKTGTQSLDLIVNNAGVNKDSVTDGRKEFVCDIKDLKRNMLLEMFSVNTIAPLMIVQKFLPFLKSDPSFIVNVSSCRASFHDEFENNNPNYGYAGSKIALNMFTYGLVKELPNNIKTFAVHPGSVRTDMNIKGDQTPYDQAKNIISITKNWKEEFNGKFLRWSGEEYPL
jgi:NAD(P)-dependent dehydrogenase (short-subunit alcohol dehydrogenase family)